MNENDRRIYSERTRIQHFSVRAAITIALAIVIAATFMNYVSASPPSNSLPSSRAVPSMVTVVFAGIPEDNASGSVVWPEMGLNQGS